MPCRRTARVEYTNEHDRYLIKYLAKYCPTKEGRSGQKIYQCLVANEQNQWPWAVHHTAQSWRERYVKHSERFDAAILNQQNKHDMKPSTEKKRVGDPIPIETLERHAKRAKREGKERVPSSETPTEQGLFMQDTNPTPPSPTPKSNPHRAPQRAPLLEPEQTHTQDSTPRQPTDSTDTQHIPDLPSVQTRNDSLESAGKQIPSPTDEESQPQPLTLPHPMKHFKERPRASSDVFASDPPTPQGDSVVTTPDVNAAGPSSEIRPAPPASLTSVDSIPAPISAPAHPLAPPRLVNTFQGQVLVDRKGRVPRQFSQGEKDALKEEEEGEEGEAKDKAQWPPVRGRAAKHKKASEPAPEVDTCHPFNQPIVPPQPEAPRETGKRVPGSKLRSPSRLVPPMVDEALPDLRTGTHGAAPEAVSEQRQDAAPSGTSSVKRVAPPPSGAVLHTPPPDLLDAVLTKWRLDKPSMFPPPRASTRSPFRPEPPPSEGHRDPRPRPLLRSPAKAARHPALTRLRRETIAHGGRNGLWKQRERRRPHANVPSVDLVALSHSSLSVRSPSRSSAEAVGLVRSKPKPKPKRWSFPVTVRRRADTVKGEGGASGSGSGSDSGSGSPSRQTASEWGRGALWTSSPTRPSTSFSSLSLALTPFSHPFSSPLPHSSSLFPSLNPSSKLVPHATDMSLAASHGLASMLARMSANHGMALGVVEAVYARVGSLREADEVLKGMREAAEGWGEREIERLVWSEGSGSGTGSRNGRKRKLEREKTRLRYVVSSEDGEGSEYSPPETSRAAMWKRYSESASHADEELEEQERGEVEVEVTEEDEEDGDVREDDDEDEEGRQVEKELQHDEDEDDVFTIGVRGERHDTPELTDTKDLWTVEQVLLDNLKAWELERRIGKSRFQRELVSRFR